MKFSQRETLEIIKKEQLEANLESVSREISQHSLAVEVPVTLRDVDAFISNCQSERFSVSSEHVMKMLCAVIGENVDSVTPMQLERKVETFSVPLGALRYLFAVYSKEIQDLQTQLRSIGTKTYRTENAHLRNIIARQEAFITQMLVLIEEE
jgi:hypothetical protein